MKNHIDLILLDIYIAAGKRIGSACLSLHSGRLQKRRYCHFFCPLTPPPLKIRFHYGVVDYLIKPFQGHAL
ncbi:two-component response regulator [Salmonella enterica subsp. enterica]|uniref:Two-component response regulator n=1 Tax=Salmonella enterica I TaxID=59201 RepID=A0A3S4HT37_SALET|nr:two-component response regulator [Salmonella enterica subsp. enterica]